MTTRIKVATTRIEQGTVTFSFYDDSEPQTIYKTDQYTVAEFSDETLHNLAAVGFATVAGNRYQNIKDYQVVPDSVARLYNEMHNGEWQPGKRDTGTDEPSDLILALSEATNTPIHVIQHEFETRMVTRQDGSLYKDAAGKSRRFFSAATQRELSEDPAVKPILARLASERAKRLSAEAKSSKSPSKLAGLFGNGEPAEAAQ